jgi:zinc-ribbon family
MLIIFGSKGRVIGQEPVRKHTCENCGKQGDSVMVVTARYFHIYWIPFFPIGKQTVCVCGNCKALKEQNEMSNALTERIQDIKNSVKIPIHHWSGLIIIGLISLNGFCAPFFESSPRLSENHGASSIEFVVPSVTEDLSFAEGNTFVFKIKKDYSLRKISRIEGDSVFFLSQRIVSSDVNIAKRYNIPDYYIDKNFGLKISEFKDMMYQNVEPLD